MNRMNPLEVDPESGAEIYLLGADERPADNIYGEQPYGDPTGRWVAVRYYPVSGRPGGISILDLMDGSRRDVVVGDPRFPAFHAWGEFLYYQETIEDRLMLRRCRYDTLEIEDVALLPPEMGEFSYGTVSPDHRYYAVSVKKRADENTKVHLLDLHRGDWTLLLDKPGYHAKHEQFSRDGRNCVLIQLNHLPKVEQVLLSELSVDGEERHFPADRPHTPRSTGHEAWVGTGERIFFSTGFDDVKNGNIWTAGSKDQEPVRVGDGKQVFGHVSVSCCGRYWLGDSCRGETPVFAGRFDSPVYKRLISTHTVYDNQQWSHAHPYMTADNQWVIFNSTRSGHAQVYGARVPAGWLERL